MKNRSTQSLTFGFLGAGQMGEAIFAGLLARQLARPRDVLIVDASAERAASMHRKHRVVVAQDANALVKASDLVVLAVKPQDLEALLLGLDATAVKGRLFVSIAAGKTLAWLEARLPGARVVRVMPNLAMRVGEGMSAYCLGKRATAADRRRVAALLTCSGKARELAESQFDAVTALSGSGPAFLATVLQAFVDGAVALGMPDDDALALAKQTMVGTAKVLSEGEASLPEFVKAVTSAKGTTAAGLAVLEASSLRGIVAKTLKAAAKRSRELGQG
jgi:pyrroline-5-carboxylate reductase